MSVGRLPVFIGWDPSEMMAWNIAATSMQDCSRNHIDVRRLSLPELIAEHKYTRPTKFDPLYDELSDAPMSTQHAIARFFVPLLCGYAGWALFTDGDVLVRDDLHKLFALREDHYAVMCVHHEPMQATNDQIIKKDGAEQHFYPRKNWSSVMLFNCGHPANRSLNLHSLNTLPGRDLHRFCWLADYEIGALPIGWNWLAGVTPAMLEPSLVHFTLGTPNMPYAKPSAYDAEWVSYARRCGYRAVKTLAGTQGGALA